MRCKWTFQPLGHMWTKPYFSKIVLDYPLRICTMPPHPFRADINNSFTLPMKPQTEASAPVSLPPDKPRYEWIDNARLIAALLIIYAHMWLFFPDEPQVTSQLATNLAHGAVLFGRVPYFLILAGYFLGRKITWHKALDRAFWLFVPFVIWNVLAYLLFNENASIQNILHEIPCILGLGSAFRFMGLHPGLPAIGVTWFLRDIIVLSLLSPLLVRFKWFLLAVVAVVVAYPGFDFKSDGVFMLAPHTCFFYILGHCRPIKIREGTKKVVVGFANYTHNWRI